MKYYRVTLIITDDETPEPLSASTIRRFLEKVDIGCSGLTIEVEDMKEIPADPHGVKNDSNRT